MQDHRLPKIFSAPDQSIQAMHNALRVQPEGTKRPRDMSRSDWIKQREMEFAHEVVDRAAARFHSSLDDVLLERTLCAWRITRELCSMKDMLMSDERISEMPFDCWEYPKQVSSDARKPDQAQIRQEIVDWQKNCPDDLGFFVGEGSGIKAIGILPPPVPVRFRDSDFEIIPEYEPDEDPLLRFWVKIVYEIAKNIGIMSNSEAFPTLVLDGLTHLVSSVNARQAWPSPVQIEAFENELIEETLILLRDGSMTSARKELVRKYGLNAKECRSLLSLARQLAMQLAEGDLEEDRGLMIMRLEEIAARAKLVGDIKGEIAAQRQLCIVLGLSRTEGKDMMNDIIDVISEASEKRAVAQAERRALESPSDKDIVAG